MMWQSLVFRHMTIVLDVFKVVQTVLKDLGTTLL